VHIIVHHIAAVFLSATPDGRQKPASGSQALSNNSFRSALLSIAEFCQTPMHRILTLLALLTSTLVQAQQFHGRVTDAGTSQPLSRVLARNLRSGALWVSDSVGNIAFTAFPGDVIRFTYTGYHESNESITSYDQTVNVRLVRAPIQLAEVRVLSPYERYKQDSAFNRTFYRKELGFARGQSKLDVTGGGIGVNGAVSDLALAISGKKRYYKNFASSMQMLEELRFSSIRYTPEAVAAQTGMSDSAAAQFIQRNPMPADFARNAGELEFKMWIRTAYRDELRQDSLKAVRKEH
jgi:hypothetical protein